MADLLTAKALVAYALHLRMYGERAPGGDETWNEWDRAAETFMRRQICARAGHTPRDPTCPEC